MKAREISIFECCRPKHSSSHSIRHRSRRGSPPNFSSPNRESSPISAISTDPVTHQTIPIWRWRQTADMLEKAKKKDHNGILRARLLRKRNHARLTWVLSALGIWDMVNHHVNPPHSSQGLAKIKKKRSRHQYLLHTGMLIAILIFKWKGRWITRLDI